MIKKKNLKLIALILILFISIGFAYLTSNLVINGLIGYKANSWNIYFDNVSMIINDVNGSKPTINNDKDTVEFNVTFSEPGESFKFSVDVVNDGTIDAMLSEILKTGINSSNSSYIDYTVKYSDDTELSINDGIRAGSKTRLNVEVTYKYDTDELAPAGNQNFSIKLTYVQAGDNANFKNTLINPDNSNIFTLNNAKSNSLNNLKIYGNNEQNTYTGQNLYNFLDQNPSDVSMIGAGTTVDGDGWITVSMDNTGGTKTIYSNYFTNNLDLVVGDTYSIVVEIKSVSGIGGLTYTSTLDNNGQFSNHTAFFDHVSPGDVIITTDTARESGKWGLRTYGYWAINQSGSITFRLSVIEGTGVTEDNFVYEPYVGGEPSPNPDYPQEVNTVTGNSSFKITGKNMYNSSYRNNGVIDVQHGTGTESGGVYTLTANGIDLYMWLAEGVGVSAPYRRDQVFEFNDKTYTATISDSRFTKNFVSCYDENMNSLGYTKFTTSSFTFDNTLKEGAKYFALRFGYEQSVNGESYLFTIQLEEGDTATTYEPYQEHVYPISLGSTELNKIGDYRDNIYYEDGDWYLEKKIGMYTITGSEDYEWYGDCPRICFNFGSIPPNNVLYPSNTTDVPYIISNKYVTVTINDIHYTTYNNRKNGFTLSNNNYISFRRKKWTDKATAVSESTGTKIYYVYRNPIKTKITDTTLLGQLNTIRNSNLFDGINHIYYDSNIDTDISFDYIEE